MSVIIYAALYGREYFYLIPLTLLRVQVPGVGRPEVGCGVRRSKAGDRAEGLLSSQLRGRSRKKVAS